MKQLISNAVLSVVLSTEILLTVATDFHFEIIRNVQRGDDILIPNVLCGAASVDACSILNARKSAACSCFCDTESSSFYESTWQCIDNKEIRELQLCGHRFQHETLTDPLRVLSPDSKETEGVVKGSEDECRVTDGHHPGYNKYLGCDGQWKSLNSTMSRDLFNVSLSWSRVFYVRLRPSGEWRNIQGKLVKLGIECKEKEGHSKRSCILFKISGETKCPVPLAKSSTPVPTIKRRTSLKTNTTPGPVFQSENTNANDLSMVSQEAGKRNSTLTTKNSGSHLVELVSGAAVAAISFAALLMLLVLALYRRKAERQGSETTRSPVQPSEADYDLPIIPLSCDKRSILNPSYERGLDRAMVVEMPNKNHGGKQRLFNEQGDNSSLFLLIPAKDAPKSVGNLERIGSDNDKPSNGKREVCVEQDQNLDCQGSENVYDEPGELLKNLRSLKMSKEIKPDQRITTSDFTPSMIHPYENIRLPDHIL